MMRPIRLFLALLFVAAFAAPAEAAESGSRYVGRCDVVFLGDSTLDSFTGEVTNLPVKVLCSTNDTGKALLNARLGISPYCLSTHNKKRDANMYKMFGADRFTNILVVVTNAALDARQLSLKISRANPGFVPLQVTMHGITRELQATLVDPEIDEEDLEFGLETALSLKDFKLEPPSMLLGAVVVRDTVKLKAHVKLQKEPP
jgi:hypothetical protein